MRIRNYLSSFGNILYSIPNSILFSAIVVLGLYSMRRVDFNLFHVSVEFFSIIISTTTFIIIWNLTKKNKKASYLLFIGVAYLFVGLIDYFHTLTYKGINIFDIHDSNLPTQLWIAARYLESLSLLVAMFLIKKGFSRALTFIFYSVLTIIIITSIFSGLFPDCYIDGSGLTRFKIFSEYIIIIILFFVLFMIRKRSKIITGSVRRYMVISVVLTIISEFLFTRFVGVFDDSNMYGHFLKLFSFVFIYKAFIEGTIKMPAQILFSSIEDSRKKLDIVQGNFSSKKDDDEEKESKEHLIIGMAAHDLRNPLWLIDNYLDILRDEMNEGKITSSNEVFEIIEKQINYSNRLINNMLTLSKLESDELVLEKELIDVGDIISELISSWNMRAKENNIRLLLCIESQDNNILVNKDSFVQILGNIISNSIKYSRQGSEVEIVVRKEAADCIIEVKDEGMGIKREELDRLFIPFQKFSNRPSGSEKSTGLGLSIVKRMVELNDGKIFISSTYGVGTEVAVVFERKNIEE